MKSHRDEMANLPGDLYGLTPVELMILKFVAKGMTRQEIADGINLSVYTVDTHLTSVYRKLGVKNAPEAVAKVVSLHLPPGLANVFC